MNFCNKNSKKNFRVQKKQIQNKFGTLSQCKLDNLLLVLAFLQPLRQFLINSLLMEYSQQCIIICLRVQCRYLFILSDFEISGIEAGNFNLFSLPANSWSYSTCWHAKTTYGFSSNSTSYVWTNANHDASASRF